jgi:hypothetical protein
MHPLDTMTANSTRNFHSNFAPEIPINHNKQYFTSKTIPNQKSPTENFKVNHSEGRNDNTGSISGQDPRTMNYSKKGRNMHQTYQQNSYPSHPQAHENSFSQSIKSVPIRHNLTPNQFAPHQTLNTPQSPFYKSKTNINLEILDLLLFSNFPLLTSKDQIYIPVVNRLENA